MRSFLKWTLIGLVVLAVFGSIQIFRRLWDAGQFVTLEKVTPGQCRLIDSPPGVEDIAIDRASGVAILSSDDRRAGTAGAGGLYALDLDDLSKPATLLYGSGDGATGPFHPHGVSLYTAPDGALTLMVVNHRAGLESVVPADHAVEIFDVARDGRGLRLVHRRTVESELYRSPNDLVAVSPDSFYVTNMLGSDTALGVTLEMFLGLNRSNVLWFDGAVMSKALEGLGMANGINVSPDGATVYVAAMSERRLRAYARNAETGALSLVNEGYFGTWFDNIDVAPDGALWIGAHPRMVDFLSHSSDPTQPSPSQILRVEPQAGGAARSLYTDEGHQISGVSVAVEHNRKIIAGTVFGAQLLVCDWDRTPGENEAAKTGATK